MFCCVCHGFSSNFEQNVLNQQSLSAEWILNFLIFEPNRFYKLGILKNNVLQQVTCHKYLHPYFIVQYFTSCLFTCKNIHLYWFKVPITYLYIRCLFCCQRKKIHNNLNFRYKNHSIIVVVIEDIATVTFLLLWNSSKFSVKISGSWESNRSVFENKLIGNYVADWLNILQSSQ